MGYFGIALHALKQRLRERRAGGEAAIENCRGTAYEKNVAALVVDPLDDGEAMTRGDCLDALLRPTQHELRDAFFRTPARVLWNTTDTCNVASSSPTTGALLRVDHTSQRQQEHSDDNERRRDRCYAPVFSTPLTYTPMQQFHPSRMGNFGINGKPGVNTRG